MYKVHTKTNQTRTPQLHQDIRKPDKRVSFSTGVIPNTSVSRPQLKSNHLEDRVMSNNSQGKKQEVEDHRRKFKFSNNKTSVTACNESFKCSDLNVNLYNQWLSFSTSEPKHNVNQSVATSSKKTVATDSTVKKSRNITRKLYEQLAEIILFIVDSGCSKHMTGNPQSSTKFGGEISGNSELLNGNSPVVSKSSAVHAADNPDKRQQHNTTHTSTTTDVADPPPLNIHS
ncbi:hypothetical protein Tco_1505322 [Tanacetum coccineum]